MYVCVYGMYIWYVYMYVPTVSPYYYILNTLRPPAQKQHGI